MPTIVSAHLEGAPQFYGHAGDLWMNTWADDDNLYLTWGDGTGRGDCIAAYATPSGAICTPPDSSVGTHPIFFVEPQASNANGYCTCPFTDAGLLMFSSTPMQPDSCEERCVVSRDIPTGFPPFHANGQRWDRDDKPSSILSVGGVLYLAGHSPLGDRAMFGYIAYSKDHGQTWHEVPGTPWTAPSPFRVLMFINMGKDYGLNTDGFVYALGIGLEANWAKQAVYLARVPASQIADYGAYRYFAGLRGGSPTWSPSPSPSVAKPLDGLKTLMQGSAMYHEGTRSYLFLTAYPGALYAAPHPWGPWRKVAELLSDVTLVNPAITPAGWHPGGYIPGVITKDAGPDYVYFTISGVLGEAHYQLTMGKIVLDLASPGPSGGPSGGLFTPIPQQIIQP